MTASETNNVADGEKDSNNTMSNGVSNAPEMSTDAVLKPSAPIPSDATEIKGIDFNHYQHQPHGITISQLLEHFSTTGFQASHIAQAVEIINKEMLNWRDPSDPSIRTSIFLGYTSNLVSSGLREVIRYLAEHRLISAIVTTAGGVEEDLIKCLGATYLGDFAASGAKLREQGINRIGNLFVPNDNYCKFEDWVVPIFDTMLQEQETLRVRTEERNAERREKSGRPADDLNDQDYESPFGWTPSKMIARLGKELNDSRSIYTWCYRNRIPVFCPALTDGSLGDMLYFHSYKSSPRKLLIDINSDIRAINDLALKAKRAGIIILGGGVVKHHIANACLMRNGADAAVYVNTANEFDGSDAGARPDEAVSWGKIREDAKAVKVNGEASVVFPLIVAGTFASPEFMKRRREEEIERKHEE